MTALAKPPLPQHLAAIGNTTSLLFPLHDNFYGTHHNRMSFAEIDKLTGFVEGVRERLPRRQSYRTEDRTEVPVARIAGRRRVWDEEIHVCPRHRLAYADGNLSRVKSLLFTKP